ncbi:MAG TPA: type I restriction-modification enzyme R subunit C-terminal domain-containing protein, partial [Myxococcota bacterium]|nr:type I restriction-modification enzyme R subunit C-terminal domain-containing protein [Myxococcota bacterium]
SIRTRLSREGISIAADVPVQAFDRRSGQIQLFRLPDQVDFEVEDFNRNVITEPFNRAVVGKLLSELDPFSPGKTLVFAVDNAHADLLVGLFREAWRERYPESFFDDLVLKITGKTDHPAEAIRRFKNETDPNVVVTVDLLTTGIDVPRIVNLVFLRRVNSRILYDQMRGRATRLCPEIGKQSFRIYDAVDLYSNLQEFSDMKPVVARAGFSLTDLAAELHSAPPGAARALVLDQILTRLHQKKGRIVEDKLEQFLNLAGEPPDQLLHRLSTGSPEQAAAYFDRHPELVAWLDQKMPYKGPIPIWDEEDTADAIEQNIPGGSVEDYLEGFRAFLSSHLNDIPALAVVTTRPRDLTRKQLRELRLALEEAGYPERTLAAAWRKQTNQEIAASIIGYVR